MGTKSAVTSKFTFPPIWNRREPSPPFYNTSRYDVMKKILNKLPEIVLGLVILLTFTYLISQCFRDWLIYQKVDPNFLIGFLTIIALLISVMQSIRDRRFAYNLPLTMTIRQRGEEVIGKLFTITTMANRYKGSVEGVITAMKRKALYQDHNNLGSLAPLEQNIEGIMASLHIYFREQSENWNTLQNKINELANIAINVVSSYDANMNTIHAGNKIKNDWLDNIETHQAKANSLHKEIETMAVTMSDGITSKVNELTGQLKNSIKFHP